MRKIDGSHDGQSENGRQTLRTNVVRIRGRRSGYMVYRVSQIYQRVFYNILETREARGILDGIDIVETTRNYRDSFQRNLKVSNG